MRRAIFALALLPLFSGCVAISNDPEVTPPRETSERETTGAVECLTVTEASIAGLQWGVDARQDGLTIEDASAIVNPATDTDSWFVAGLMTGPGFGDGEIGVWYTMQDPTTAEGDSIAFVSVDGIASEFSVYAQPDGFNAALDGVDEVRDCLG